MQSCFRLLRALVKHLAMIREGLRHCYFGDSVAFDLGKAGRIKTGRMGFGWNSHAIRMEFESHFESRIQMKNCAD